MFHWLFHLDVYPSQQVDSVIPPNLKTAQQVGIALNRRNCPKHLDPKIFGTRSSERQTNSPFQQRCPPLCGWSWFFFSVNHVFPPPPIFGWKPPPASASVPLPPALVPLPLGPEPCWRRFLEGRWKSPFAVRKSIPEMPFVYSTNGVGLTILHRQKKSYIQWSTEKQLSPHQTSDWLIMVCSVSYFTS